MYFHSNSFTQSGGNICYRHLLKDRKVGENSFMQLQTYFSINNSLTRRGLFLTVICAL